jgi:hypothetical protein
MDELSQALERVCFLDWRLEQLEATLQDAHARNQGLRRELAEVSGARQRELAEQASLSERLTEARREAQSLEERLALSERARASSEAHARGLDRRWMERLAEAQAQGERERQRAEVASRALADARQRLDVLERAHAAFFLRLESWQRLLGQDPDHVDLAEFISDLRAEIERLSEEQVRAHRRETRLRLALVETGARVPAEAALVAPLPEEEATARRGPPQVSLRDAVLGRRARRPADRSAARLDVDRSPSARVPAADAPTAHAPAAAAPRATPAPAGLVRKDAFDALETARPGPVADAHAGLLWEVAEASQDRALAAARTLAERVGAAAAPAVILRLNAAADPEAQVAWLGALARTAGPVAEQAALRCASDEVWSVRAAATDALAALTEGTARRDALRRALADPDARVRRRAALAAAQWLGRDAEPLVAPLLEDPSPGTRRLATTILRRASTRRVGQALAPALTPKRSPPWST